MEMPKGFLRTNFETTPDGRADVVEPDVEYEDFFHD